MQEHIVGRNPGLTDFSGFIRFAHPEGRPSDVQRASRFCRPCGPALDASAGYARFDHQSLQQVVVKKPAWTMTAATLIPPVHRACNDKDEQ